MTRTLLTVLAALSLLVVTAAPARAYDGWQVGIWTHTATVDDHSVKVMLEVTAGTIHCTVRTKEGPANVTITVDASYVMSRDGLVVGILGPDKIAPKDEKHSAEERAFTCRLAEEKDGIVVSDVSGGGTDKEQIKKVFEGRYRRVETKASTAPSKSREPVVTPSTPAPAPPPSASPPSPPRDAVDTVSATKASFGPPDPTRLAELHARTSVRFAGPKGLKVAWRVEKSDGEKTWGDEVLEAPAKHDFAQGAVYRLKLSDIPDNTGLTLYPTLEVVPGNGQTRSFLSEHSVPVGFTADDFRAVKAGDYVVKVIYLIGQPQDFFSGEVGEVISTQVDAGVDPIAEATRRGSILAVVRMGNIELGKRALPAINYPPPGDVRSPRWLSPGSRLMRQP
jgi:hypothetical protein